MNVYYQNALKSASLSMTNLAAGESTPDLTQQDLQRTVLSSAPSSVITATFSVQNTRAADTLFISNTNALQGTLRLYNQNQVLQQTINIQLGHWNNKITFPAMAVGKMELTLQASGANLYTGLVFLTLGVVLPRFAVGVDMSDEIRGTGNKSAGGQTYGIRGVTLETDSFSWKRVTALEKETVRRYIDEVQLDVNHYISPYVGIDQYVTITDAGGWKKYDGNGFYWDTEINYKEAR
jgi:hypothetical protein